MTSSLFAFRWVLGLLLALTLGGYALIAVIGSGFRRSFGASPLQPLLLLLPAIVMILMLAALIVPASKILLHVAAGAAFVAALGSFWCIFMEGAHGFWLVAGYLGAWFVFYSRVM